MITSRPDHKILLPNQIATQELGARIAAALLPALVIYVHGELGAGKTTLVRAILKAMGYEGITKSPSFTMVEIYELDELDLYHYDLYRLADPAELDFIGIRDDVASPAVKIFEWASHGRGHIPAADLEITLQLDGEGRCAYLSAGSDLGRKIIQQLQLDSA